MEVLSGYSLVPRRLDERAELRSVVWVSAIPPCRPITGGPTYPAGIGIEKPPPYAVFDNIFHPPTTVEEDSEHALPQVYDAGVFLSPRRFGSVVRHRVLLGNWGDDQSRM